MLIIKENPVHELPGRWDGSPELAEECISVVDFQHEGRLDSEKYLVVHFANYHMFCILCRR